MKTKLLQIAFLITTFSANAQSPVCFTNPDAVDGSGWSYKDYIIPIGYKLDSVFMDASRPGYTPNDFDFVLESCQGTTVYNHTIGTYPFLFSTDNNSEYNIWINLTSFNYSSIGMVRVSLPTGSGAIWNQVCFAISPKQTPTCFTTPDGTDGNGWSYKDYVIPTGFKLDSVFMDATRPGFSPNDFDFVLESCAGSTVYNHSIGTYPFLFSTDNNSEYNIWINLTSFNYISTGMVRVALPTNAGAIWNEVCFAISPQITTSINSYEKSFTISIFPNPATNLITLKNCEDLVDIELYNVYGQLITRIKSVKDSFDVSHINKGFYIAKITDSNSKVKTISFIKE